MPAPKIHGLSDSPEYRAWSGMKTRCSTRRNPDYRYYGGRGIKVCQRWQRFENFYADMGPRPSPAHSLDRINGNGNYEPSNCRWATAQEQNRNRRNVRVATLNGRTLSVVEWVEILGLPPQTVQARIKRGSSNEQALTVGRLPMGGTRVKGEQAVTVRKLSAEQLAEIHDPANQKPGDAKRLAEKFGVHRNTISAARHGRTFAWTKGE